MAKRDKSDKKKKRGRPAIVAAGKVSSVYLPEADWDWLDGHKGGRSAYIREMLAAVRHRLRQG